MTQTLYAHMNKKKLEKKRVKESDSVNEINLKQTNKQTKTVQKKQLCRYLERDESKYLLAQFISLKLSVVLWIK
jgi:hypothetical protein